MDGHQKFKMGHMIKPRSFQERFVIRRLGLATINLCTKYEVPYTFTHCGNIKGDEKCKIWGCLGIKRSLKVTDNLTIR